MWGPIVYRMKDLLHLHVARDSGNLKHDRPLTRGILVTLLITDKHMDEGCRSNGSNKRGGELKHTDGRTLPNVSSPLLCSR